MAQPKDDRTMNLTMDAANIYREDVYTDRRIGTIRTLVPVKSDGSADAARKTIFIGEAQIMVPWAPYR